MFKTWFGLISVILFVSLVNVIVSFNLFDILHWIYLIVLIIATVLTIIVYLENPSKKSKNIEEVYSDFLKEKDRKIEELQNKNEVIFKTAFKKAEEQFKDN